MKTVNCKSCGALVYDHDIPSKKTGYCWRCQVHYLTAENKRLRAALEHSRRA